MKPARIIHRLRYFVADAWDGPYRIPQDRNNLLIGAGNRRADAYVARAIRYKGEPLLYYH